MNSDSFDAGDEFFSILNSIGIVANIMVSPSDSNLDADHTIPLMLKWGFIDDIDSNNEFFRDVVKSFDSPIKWILHDNIRKSEVYPNGFVRWWLFYPARLDKIVEEKKTNLSYAQQWISDNEPSFGLATNQEFKNFVRHFKVCYEKWKTKKNK